MFTHFHEEIAPVTRYHDQYIADPEHTEPVDVVSRVTDPETGVSVVPVSAISARSSSEQTVQSLPTESAVMMLPDTPFFHLDLAAAVKAAEKGLSRAPSVIDAGSVKGPGDD